MKRLVIAIYSALILTLLIKTCTSVPGPISPLSPLAVRRTVGEFLYLPIVVGGNGAPEPTNWGFEEGQCEDCPQYQWIVDINDPYGKRLGPYLTHFIELWPPTGWGVAWIEGMRCEATPAYFSGRPESGLIEWWEDDVRVAEGGTAAKIFTFWRCSILALFQRATFTPGEYRFSAMMHSWFSDCDHYPYSPWPGIVDKWTGRCRELPNASAVLQVCVDPTGGIDPWSDDVICGPEVEQYGRYGPRIYSSWVWLDRIATIFLRFKSDTPLKHSDFYPDAVRKETR